MQLFFFFLIEKNLFGNFLIEFLFSSMNFSREERHLLSPESYFIPEHTAQ